MSAEASCRNCLSSDTLASSNAYVAPFFARRVLKIDPEPMADTIRLRLARARPGAAATLQRAVFRALMAVGPVRRFLERRGRLRTRIRVCRHCGFVGPEFAYSFDMLKSLYVDYRSATYNADRCAVEPEYAALQDHVGKDDVELANRMRNIDALLAAHVDVARIASVLDWGGGEGKFIPTALRDKRVTVLDVSDEPLANSAYVRVDELDAGQAFDFVQICHVLEHMAQPADTLAGILAHVRPGGIVYVEVPQDRTEADIEALERGAATAGHIVHEHLNLYTPRSVEALGRASGLTPLVVQAFAIDMGWSTHELVSGLFTKP